MNRINIRDFGIKDRKVIQEDDPLINKTCSISIESSKRIKPYIRLASLKTIVENLNNKQIYKPIIGINRNFDPRNIVETINASMDKLYEDMIKKNEIQKKKIYPARIVRKFTQNVSEIRNDSPIRIKFKQKRKTTTFLNIKGLSHIMDKDELLKTQLKVNPKIQQRNFTIANELKKSLATYNNTKNNHNKSLIEVLNTQTSNRHKAIGYKKYNFDLTGGKMQMGSIMRKTMIKSERQCITDHIDNIKNYTKAYYRLVCKLIDSGNELSENLYSIMDYYKTIIENGDKINLEHVIYLLSNFCPKEEADQLVEYIIVKS